jgi:hypothetical protein
MDEFDYNSVPPKKEFKVDVEINHLGKGEPLPYPRMGDEKLKEMADFEDKNPCFVMSPNLQQKLKQHFFYVAWQDAEGRIIDIKHYDDYDTALMRAMQNAKATGTTYTIRDLKGRLVDSNYISK